MPLFKVKVSENEVNDMSEEEKEKEISPNHMEGNENSNGNDKYSWYSMFFGSVDSLEPLRIRGGEEVEVEILDIEPGIRFRNNKPWRPYLRVRVGDKKYILWLHKKSLAFKILLIQKKYGSLEGLKVRIRAPTGEGEDRFYQVQVIE